MIPVRTSVEVAEIPGAVIGLIIANIVVFLVQIGLPAEFTEQFINQNALVPGRYTSPEVAEKLALDPGNFLPFLTNSFMHVGWLHLIVNMWTLWLFGGALEERLGALRFVLFYLACGLVASLSHFAINFNSAIPALGASGAIAGILGGFALLYPRASVTLLTPIFFFPIFFRLIAAVYMALWFAFQIVPGVATLFAPENTGGVAWWAHIGGFITGFALIRFIGVSRNPREIGPVRERLQEIGAPRERVLRIDTGRPGRRFSDIPTRQVGRFLQAAPGGGAGDGSILERAQAGVRRLQEQSRGATAPSLIPATGGDLDREDTRQGNPWASVDASAGQISQADEDEALALIGQLRAGAISAETVAELEGYREDISTGRFETMDLDYLRALHARLT
ncbi:MAG: hypothetical protein CMM10_12750 [Rhodospirillaceae bacterium]|jgi:membrane associated rhomboid family serine protease|nr:hypothetical protein [Rhodospirillaceae bacterium]|tara:strand:- start:2263 stop:3441 length:1179 start_codon:yes stop_codon:yes gene_type:complete